jgi:hydroxyethylthiazole kinase-like uncharacterized protein yjeF
VRYGHGVDKVRAAEAELMARLPEGTLMQRAATGLATVCAGLLPAVYGARIVLLVGGGDNGGDALFAGAALARRGAGVHAVLAGSRVHEGGLHALLAAGGRTTDDLDVIHAADLVIDGLTGIGGTGPLREPYARLVEAANQAPATLVACDVPSGVDASTGEVAGETAIQADVTVTFGTYKPGLLIDPGASHTGVVELVDIGLQPPEPDVIALQAADVRPPGASAESDKYRRGVLGLLAGSERYPGAAVLSTGSAIHGGAGMVRFAAPLPVVEVVRSRWPEAVTTPLDKDTPFDKEKTLNDIGRVQAWAVGPGLGTGDEAEALVQVVLSTDLPVLVDADGLTVLSRRRDLLKRSAPTVLTPHAGELARLLDADRSEIEARRLEFARRAAAELGATVLLKGSTTLIAEHGLPVRVNSTGTPLLATAGSGDVLTGLIGALLAGGLSAIDAASAGAFLHGLAARLISAGHAPISAADVIAGLPHAFATVGRSGG